MQGIPTALIVLEPVQGGSGLHDRVHNLKGLASLLSMFFKRLCRGFSKIMAPCWVPPKKRP